LAGLALVTLGVLYKVKFNDAIDALPPELGIAPVLSIIIGIVVFVTAFFGCCGAVKESPCMLTTYSIILLTIFIVQVALGVYAFIQIKDERGLRDNIHKFLSNTFNKYDTNERAKETTDLIQRFLQCCGVENYSEMTRQNGSLPVSCCKQSGHSCRPADFNNIYITPCNSAANSFLQNSAQVIGGVAIGIAVIEMSCCGVDGPDEYEHRWHNNTLPQSCCPVRSVPVTCEKVQGMYYHNSCALTMYDFVSDSAPILGGVAIGICILELIGAFLGLCLANSIKNQYRRSLYA
ncbi:Tetraspannin domain containing protein, partial [Asbolus verrucosus]